MADNKELIDLLNEIKLDKETNLKPENLKAGITCFGIQGTNDGVSVKDTTALPKDVTEGKFYYNALGKKEAGTAPKIELSTKPINNSFSINETDINTSYIRKSAMYIDKFFYWKNHTLFCKRYDLNNEVDTFDTSEYTSAYTDINYLDVGCLNCIRDNTLLIVLVIDGTRQWYTYNFETRTFQLESINDFGNEIVLKRETSTSYLYSAYNIYLCLSLHPTKLYAQLPRGIANDVSSSRGIIAKINADFSLTSIITLPYSNASGTGTGYIIRGKWVSEHILYMENKYIYTNKPMYSYNEFTKDTSLSVVMQPSYTSFTKWSDNLKSSYFNKETVTEISDDEKYVITSYGTNRYLYIMNTDIYHPADNTKIFTLTPPANMSSYYGCFFVNNLLFMSYGDSSRNTVLYIYKIEGTEVSKINEIKNMKITPSSMHHWPHLVKNDIIYNIAVVNDGIVIDKINYDNNVTTYNTADASAVAKDLIKGKVAYSKEGKIIGSLESNIKLFETIDEMDNNSNETELDSLGVVYKNEIGNMTSSSKIQTIAFPETVTLPQAITESKNLSLYPEDTSTMVDARAYISSTNFNFNMYSEDKYVSVNYDSSDGINYTLSSTLEENPIDLGTKVFVYMESEWDNIFGYFLQVNNSIFEGIYKNSLVDDEDYINCYKVVDTENRNLRLESYEINIAKIKNIYAKIIEDYNIQGSYICPLLVFEDIDDNKDPVNLTGYALKRNGNTINSQPGAKLALLQDNSLVLTNAWNDDGFTTATTNPTAFKINFNLIDNTYSIDEIALTRIKDVGIGNRIWFKVIDLENEQRFFTSFLQRPDRSSLQDLLYYIETAEGVDSYNKSIAYKKIQKYLPIDTQLNTSPDEVLNEKLFFGKNGIEIGTLGSNISNKLNDNNAEIYSKVQSYLDSREPYEITYDSRLLREMKFIPRKSDGTSLINITTTDGYALFTGNDIEYIIGLDLSNLNSYSQTFSNCQKLKYIKDCGNLKSEYCYYMFYNCYSLEYLPEINMTENTNMNYFAYNCRTITVVPHYNTSKVTDFRNAFKGCISLISIPLLETIKVTSNRLYGIIEDCPNLSDESLNNVLAMCKNSNCSASYKTLKYTGFTEEQLERAKTLSNYQAVLDAGWTTGY